MAPQRRDIFLHFLNRDSRQIYGLFREFEALRHENVLGRALNAAAILCETRCIAPPGFIVECDIAQEVVKRKSAYLRERLFELPMRETALSDYVEKKRQEYEPMRALYTGLFDDQRIQFLSDNALGLIPRKAVIGESIAKHWLAGPDENKRSWRPVSFMIRAKSIDFLRTIPRQLIDRGIAATWPAILNLLPRDASPVERELRRVLQHDYFSLYAREFNLVVLRNLPLMQDNFGLSSEPKIYDFEWLRTCLSQIGQECLLNASAEAILYLRKQYGFIRFVDAYAGACVNCNTITDLRFHVDRLAHATRIPWRAIAEFWKKNIQSQEFEFEENRASELADALGLLAARIEIEFSLSARINALTRRTATLKDAVQHVRMIMKGGHPELVIFVALEEEFATLEKRWDLKRAFVELAAGGNINGMPVDVICAKNMGRVPAAVATGFYLASRRDDPPQLVLILGLAGGFEDEKIEEGMIIIPHTVVDLATRKIHDKDNRTTTEFRRKDFPLDQIVYDYITSNDFDLAAWQQSAINDADWPAHRRPSVHPGLISSLDEVVSSSRWRKALLKSSPKLLGVEMEAGGVCAAAGRYNIPVSMIRAVADKADPSKADTQWRTRGMKTIATLVEAIDWHAITERLKDQ